MGCRLNYVSRSKMPRGVKKEHLPNKICVICERPFNWRKKWERCWDEVTTCSNRCNSQRRQLKHAFAEADEDEYDDENDENEASAGNNAVESVAAQGNNIGASK